MLHAVVTGVVWFIYGVPRLCWSLCMVEMWQRCERERTLFRVRIAESRALGCVLYLEIEFGVVC